MIPKLVFSISFCAIFCQPFEGKWNCHLDQRLFKGDNSLLIISDCSRKPILFNNHVSLYRCNVYLWKWQDLELCFLSRTSSDWLEFSHSFYYVWIIPFTWHCYYYYSTSTSDCGVYSGDIIETFPGWAKPKWWGFLDTCFSESFHTLHGDQPQWGFTNMFVPILWHWPFLKVTGVSGEQVQRKVICCILLMSWISFCAYCFVQKFKFVGTRCCFVCFFVLFLHICFYILFSLIVMCLWMCHEYDLQWLHSRNVTIFCRSSWLWGLFLFC